MNIIDQISSLKKDLSNINFVLKLVKSNLINSKSDVKIAGKTLRQANVEQPALQAYYDEIRIHLQSVTNYIEIKMLEQRAKLLRMISEESKIDYGERLKEKLIEDDTFYMELKLKKLEVDEVLEMTKAIGEQFKTRGYSLRNISDLVVAQAQDENLILNDD